MDHLQEPRRRTSPRLADTVSAELARLIATGGLPSGVRLPTERELMRRFGVSRSAVRAAIGDPERFYATDAAFHALLYRLPRNPIFPEVHRAYVEWLQDHWRCMPRGAEYDRLNHAAHAEILAAIIARDPDAAEAALRRHLTTAWELLRAALPPALPAEGSRTR
ncbi:FCD domain-containing protein [Belnapia sp. T6]|uniref:FCD domain-containing protein n=1 Tax=Belnapia mucosa TaxID=2804532 RepID=A0ABS1UZA4_9PROT|nr:FCD domain-containing protein [Belnapia mucosa]MBL6454632.1 FCD domain-containing protein [Belnapia mucosa]